MDSLDNKNLVWSKFQHRFVIFPFSGDEIVRRKLYFSACQQVFQIFVKLLCIDSFDTFIIVFPVFVFRRIDTIDKIVIESDRMRFQTKCL